jgi:hypothetical protein
MQRVDYGTWHQNSSARRVDKTQKAAAKKHIDMYLFTYMYIICTYANVHVYTYHLHLHIALYVV